MLFSKNSKEKIINNYDIYFCSLPDVSWISASCCWKFFAIRCGFAASSSPAYVGILSQNGLLYLKSRSDMKYITISRDAHVKRLTRPTFSMGLSKNCGVFFSEYVTFKISNDKWNVKALYIYVFTNQRIFEYYKFLRA